MTSLGRSASVVIQSDVNTKEYSLILRQRDVKKANWAVSVNGRKLGVLEADERDMLRVLTVPAGTLRTGSNTVQITGEGAGLSDDIEISYIRLEAMPVNEFLRQATISVVVTSAAGPMPVRLTIVDQNGSLTPFVSLRPGAYEAHRTGVLYTPDGTAEIGLPAGNYRIFASRGFEYSASSQSIRVRSGDVHKSRLQIRREVTLTNYVSCDPHVHTFELSRHGDASVDERVLTAAGEGLDILVATEHNRAEDHTAAVRRRKLDRWTLSVPGNEVTTSQGHFNIFPTRPGTPQPDPRVKDWASLMRSNFQTEGVQVVVQNHPRDLHSAYRPFDPSHHLSSVGVNLNGRPMQANAMEVVNSGAMSSDILQLALDWLGLLTSGLPVAAIGSSDTHTVDFVPIGQARTYIRVDALTKPWRNDVEGVFQSLAQGRNLVSYGLAAELRVTGTIGPKGSELSVPVEVVVHGPSWSSVDRVRIYSNGQMIREESFAPVRKAGVKIHKKLTLAMPGHDTALVAIATGPGVSEPFWEVRKPYQPVSMDWTPMVIGVSRAVWLDGDGDSRRTAPIAYAEQVTAESGNNPQRLVQLLGRYDRSVAMHTLNLLRSRGMNLSDTTMKTEFENGSTNVREGYAQFIAELKHVMSGAN